MGDGERAAPAQSASGAWMGQDRADSRGSRLPGQDGWDWSGLRVDAGREKLQRSVHGWTLACQFEASLDGCHANLAKLEKSQVLRRDRGKGLWRRCDRDVGSCRSLFEA